MSKSFKIKSNFEPSGDQPQAIQKIVKGLKSGLLNQTLKGVTGSGKTFAMANVIENLQRPAIVMSHNKTLAAQLYGEFKEFFPDNAVEYFVSYYDYYQPEAYVPSSDVFIEKDASINEHIEQMRLSATKAVLERRDVIIVATVSAIYGLGDPKSYLKMVLHLDRGDELELGKLLLRLAELQYTRNDIEFKRATYRVKGDVVDIFPAESEKEALRVEFFDKEILYLKELKVVVTLGKVAFDNCIKLYKQKFEIKKKFYFKHGNAQLLPNGLIILSSYHPSPRNVNTKLISNKMMVDLFKKAKKLAKF